MAKIELTSVLLPWGRRTVELNDCILAAAHPVWFFRGQLLASARLQTHLDVGFKSSQGAQWRRTEAAQGGAEADGVIPVPVARQLPVVEVAFK